MSLKIISVFFNCSGAGIESETSLINFLYRHIDKNDSSQKAEVYNGCGITHGIPGMLFGTGLNRPVRDVIDMVEQEIANGHTVRINAIGHSRGACAAQLLALQLRTVSPELLTINLILIDPVPGNYIPTANIDGLDISIASKTWDLRECKNLVNVSLFYACTRLHPILNALPVAPSLSLYPETTCVNRELLPDHHDNLGDISSHEFDYIKCTKSSFIIACVTYELFTSWGSVFKPLPNFSWQYLVPSGTQWWCPKSEALVPVIDIQDPRERKGALLGLYKHIQASNAWRHRTTMRMIGSGHHIQVKAGQVPYYNRHHATLMEAPTEATVRVSIELSNGPFARLKRASVHHPKKFKLLKWTLVSIGITSLIITSGGIAAIPIIGGISLHIGFTATVAALSPIVGTIASGLWYLLVKPCVSWAINRFFYPEFAISNVSAPITPPDDYAKSTSNGKAIEKEPKEQESHAHYDALWTADNPEKAPIAHGQPKSSLIATPV